MFVYVPCVFAVGQWLWQCLCAGGGDGGAGGEVQATVSGQVGALAGLVGALAGPVGALAVGRPGGCVGRPGWQDWLVANIHALHTYIHTCRQTDNHAYIHTCITYIHTYITHIHTSHKYIQLRSRV